MLNAEQPQVVDDAGTRRTGVDPAFLPLVIAIQQLAQRSVDLAEHMRQASEVNATDFRALTHVQLHPGITAGELGELLDRSPGAVSTIVDHLVDVGHLERRRDAEDRRRVTLWVTDQPQRVAARTLAPLIARLQDEFADADPADRAALADGLARITATLAAFLDEGGAAPGGD